MRVLESAARDPVPLLRDALVDVSGVTAALLFGSMAAGMEQTHSDIDVLILEDAQAIEKTRLYRNLAEVGLILGREVNVVRYTASALSDRLGDPTHAGWGFVHQVLTEPKKLLAGSKEPLQLLASAAGINGDALKWAAA
jgi:predicted nucleotidyltransferase